MQPSNLRVADRYQVRVASWMGVKKFFPNVSQPIFHATRGPRAVSIALRGEGIKSSSGYSDFGGQVGVSCSRNLSFLLKGDFGNVIFVLDYKQLASRYQIDPVQHPIGDEYEERVQADALPASLIQGVIFNTTLMRPIAQEWVEAVPYPVVHRSRDNSWVQAL